MNRPDGTHTSLREKYLETLRGLRSDTCWMDYEEDALDWAIAALSTPHAEVRWPTEAKRSAEEPEDWIAITGRGEHHMDEDQAQIWNACRAAMLAAIPPKDSTNG